MNVSDLRTELDARSRPGDDLLGAVRLAAVRHRVRATRQRRIATGGATTLIVIVAVMTGYGLIGPATSTPNHAAGDGLVNGFPRYAAGAVLVETQTVTLPGGVIGMTTTANAFGLAFAQRCHLAGRAEAMVTWSVGRREVGTFACGRGAGTFHTLAGASWSDLGIRDGDTVRVTARLTARDAAGDVGGGSLAAALMRRVPFDQYPLPPRPDTLVPLDRALRPIAITGTTFVDSDPADPAAVRNATVEPADGVVIRLTAQTPGSVQVVLNGVVVCTAEWWDYKAAVHECPYAPTWSSGPMPLAIALVPKRLTGAWRASVRTAR